MCGLRYFNLQMNLTIGLGRQRFKIGSPVHDNLRQKLLFSFSNQETAGLRNIFQIRYSQCYTLALNSIQIAFPSRSRYGIPIPIPIPDTHALLSILRFSKSESAFWSPTIFTRPRLLHFHVTALTIYVYTVRCYLGWLTLTTLLPWSLL